MRKEYFMQDRKKVSLVTGGSRGIGRAICMSLAQPGDAVVFNHFDPDELEAEKTLAMLEERGVSCMAAKFDVSDPAQVNEFMDKVVETYGGIDNLVNNAGITMDALIIRMKPENFERVLKVNLTGSFVCLQAAAKYMIKQRSGSIVNVASVVGATGNFGQANYAASKAGVMALTKTAAKEFASRNIRVNCVAPGFILTEMTKYLPERAIEAFKSSIPNGQPGQPEDVADVIAFLCSEAARYMTGQVLHINGGMYM